jgi:hypothetical protein
VIDQNPASVKKTRMKKGRKGKKGRKRKKRDLKKRILGQRHQNRN